jgi:hypothetical protein
MRMSARTPATSKRPDVALQPLVAGPVQGGAKRRCDVGRHRDAAVAAGEAERGLRRVIARQQQELRAQAAAQPADAGDVAGSVLEAHDARQLAESAHRHIVQGAGGARRHVVEHDRDADGIVDGAEVNHHAGLRRLEIGRGDAEQGLRAGPFGGLRELDRRPRVVAAGAGDHRHPSGRGDDRGLDDPAVLVGRERRPWCRTAPGQRRRGRPGGGTAPRGPAGRRAPGDRASAGRRPGCGNA